MQVPNWIIVHHFYLYAFFFFLSFFTDCHVEDMLMPVQML